MVLSSTTAVVPQFSEPEQLFGNIDEDVSALFGLFDLCSFLTDVHSCTSM